MKKVFGRYKEWTLILVPNWHGEKTTFFIVAPGPDPKVLVGDRPTHDEALVAGRKAIIHEARNASHNRS